MPQHIRVFVYGGPSLGLRPAWREPKCICLSFSCSALGVRFSSPSSRSLERKQASTKPPRHKAAPLGERRRAWLRIDRPPFAGLAGSCFRDRFYRRRRERCCCCWGWLCQAGSRRRRAAEGRGGGAAARAPHQLHQQGAMPHRGAGSWFQSQSKPSGAALTTLLLTGWSLPSPRLDPALPA